MLREAVAEARRAREVEPLSGVYAANVAWKLYLAHQYDEAELESRKLTAWNPNFTGGYILASVYLQTGHQAEAVAELQKSVTASHRSVLNLMYLGHALGVWGARAEGQKVLEEMQYCRNEDTFRPSTSPLFMKASASANGRCSGSKRRTRNDL